MSSIQFNWLKFVLVMSMAAASLNLAAAELRTSAGARPVSRTVAPVSHSAPLVEEMPIEASDCAGSCSSCSGGHACGTQICQTCCFQTDGLYAEAEFLLARRHGIRFPPLVTTSPQGTVADQAGVLDLATTTIVYPTEAIGEEARPGARFTIGTWLDPGHCWGIEARYFLLADEETNFSADSTGNPILARPFFDVPFGVQASRLIAFNGVDQFGNQVVNTGNISITTESEVHGGDAFVRRAVCEWGCGRVELLAGYQYSRIDESLTITDFVTLVVPPPLLLPGTTSTTTDSFATRNEYHAGSIGAAGRFEQDAWRLDLLGKIGFGNMQETVSIRSSGFITDPAGGVVNDPGLLAQNVHRDFSQDRFAVSPEVNARATYRVNDCIDVFAGYTFVYWSRVAQPGDQIDPQLHVPPRQLTIRDSEYWIHALTLGGQVRF